MFISKMAYDTPSLIDENFLIITVSKPSPIPYMITAIGDLGDVA